MIDGCPRCGGRVLTATMTPEEEAQFAAAFVCTKCGARLLETWSQARAPRGKRHVPISER